MAADKTDPALAKAAEAAATRWPVLRDKGIAVGWGPAQSDERQLEFYPPWEERNPQRGKPFIEVYNRGLAGDELSNAIAGDMLHYLAAIDPRTQTPIDPAWRNLRSAFARTITPEQAEIDRRAYEASRDPRPFDQWHDASRLDAYIRGLLLG